MQKVSAKFTIYILIATAMALFGCDQRNNDIIPTYIFITESLYNNLNRHPGHCIILKEGKVLAGRIADGQSTVVSDIALCGSYRMSGGAIEFTFDDWLGISGVYRGSLVWGGILMEDRFFRDAGLRLEGMDRIWPLHF